MIVGPVAHRTAWSRRVKKRPRTTDQTQAGCMNTKLQAVTDANGRPISRFVRAGQPSDYTPRVTARDIRQPNTFLSAITLRSGQMRMLIVVFPHITNSSPVEYYRIFVSIVSNYQHNRLRIAQNRKTRLPVRHGGQL